MSFSFEDKAGIKAVMKKMIIWREAGRHTQYGRNIQAKGGTVFRCGDCYSRKIQTNWVCGNEKKVPGQIKTEGKKMDQSKMLFG